MSIFAPLGKPKTPLGEHRILSPSAGVRVSPLCLGAMSLGNAWEHFMGGGIDKEEAFKFLDVFYEAGGNFIDTSNNYQDEQSELWVGEWMAARKNRDEIVLATKFTTGYVRARQGVNMQVNYTGNHTKSLHVSLRDSLEKLKTDYIDVLYVHWWDYTTSVPEMMQALDAVVKSGKVLYLGISDTPAWIVSKANEYARGKGMAQFVVYQGKWSCLERDFERDILPMCHAEGMGIAPWGVIGRGRFRTAAQLTERKKEGAMRAGPDELSEREKKMNEALEKVANEVGGDASLANIAIAYCMHKQAYVFPIIGGRKPEYLLDNIKALSIKLTDQQIELLDNAVPFDLGFPLNLIGPDPALGHDGRSKMPLLNSSSRLQYVKASPPISHE